MSTKERMRKSLLVLAVLVAACRAHSPNASPPQDDAEPAPRLVVTEFGREIDVRWLALTARDSRNSEFVLCFQPVDQPRQGRRLEVQQEGWDPSSSGGHADALGEWHSFVVLPASRLDGVVEASKLEPARYVERDVALVADCSLDRTSITAVDGVRVSWVIENRGADSVRYTGGGGRGVFGSPCSFELLRDGVAVAHHERLGGGGGHRMSSPSELAPGARIRRHERVEWEFSLDEPGDYQLSARFWLPVVEPVPRYSRADACPVVAASCGEVFDASLAFSVRR